MRRLVAVFAILVAGFGVSSAFAADAFIVTESQKVSTSIGRGFTAVPRARPKPVRAGTQVMANETGSGWIIYCGCDVEIRPGRVYTVENRECKVESVDIRREGLPHIVNYPDGQRGEEVVTKCRIAPWWFLAGGLAGLAFIDDDDDFVRRRAPPPQPASP